MKRSFYKKHRISEIIRIDEILTIHYLEFSKSYQFAGEEHNFWELVYVDKGKAIVGIDHSKNIILKAGEMVFHKPNEFHTIGACKEAPPNIFIISFVCDSPAMSYFEGRHFMLARALRFHISEIYENARRTFVMPMNGIKLVLLKNPVIGGEQMIKTHLEQMLIEIMRETTQNAFSTSKELLDNNTVNTVISILQENLYGKIGIPDICAKTNYGKTYLCTLFKNLTGKSIMEYYSMLKIDEAKRLIKEDKYSFSQISDLLMYSNPNYFSRAFRKETGMAPREYKGSVMYN